MMFESTRFIPGPPPVHKFRSGVNLKVRHGAGLFLMLVTFLSRANSPLELLARAHAQAMSSTAVPLASWTEHAIDRSHAMHPDPLSNCQPVGLCFQWPRAMGISAFPHVYLWLLRFAAKEIKSDCWSGGCVLYFMLEGKAAFNYSAPWPQPVEAI